MNLHKVNWDDLPAPTADGAAEHLTGLPLPKVTLPATQGAPVRLDRLAGTAVLYCYPMTGRPDRPLPDGWDALPGARGCTPQSCAYRDRLADLRAVGVQSVYGISTQGTAYQAEAAERLHLPFPLLSDAGGALRHAMDLPSFEVDGVALLRRLTLIVQNGVVAKVFYPVFPPDADAEAVIAWAGGGT